MSGTRERNPVVVMVQVPALVGVNRTFQTFQFVQQAPPAPLPSKNPHTLIVVASVCLKVTSRLMLVVMLVLLSVGPENEISLT